MDIQTLKEFLVLSKILNYRMTAEMFFITQPTLSKHIKVLEDELDTKLFNRSTKEVSLTENGRVFREHAQKIVDEYESAHVSLSGKRTVSGILKIGGAIRFPLINNLITTALTSFENKYPDVTVIIEDIQWEDYRTRLLNSVYDIIISLHLPNQNDEGLEFYDICEEEFCAWLHKDNPFGDVEAVSFEELSHLSLRILNEHKTEVFASYVRELFANRGLDVAIGKPLSQIFVMDGRSFTLTPGFDPETFFGPDTRLYKLDERETVPITIVRKKHASNPVAQLFFDEFVTAAQDRFGKG